MLGLLLLNQGVRLAFAKLMHVRLVKGIWLAINNSLLEQGICVGKLNKMMHQGVRLAKLMMFQFNREG